MKCNSWKEKISTRIGQVSFLTTKQEVLCLDYLTGLIKSPARTYNAIHNKFMKIKSMLIKNGYPKAYLDRCIMKYLNMQVPLLLSRKKRQ